MKYLHSCFTSPAIALTAVFLMSCTTQQKRIEINYVDDLGSTLRNGESFTTILDEIPRDLATASSGQIHGLASNEVEVIRLQFSCGNHEASITPLRNKWTYQLKSESGTLCGPKMRINITALGSGDKLLQQKQILLGGF